MATNKTTLTTGEAAKYCGVNFRTVIRWIERGHLKAYKLPGRGDNRIPIEDFKQFLNDSGIPVPSELLDTEDRVQQPDTKQKAKESGSPTVLVVDDDKEMAKSIQRVLKRKGYNIVLAHNGFQAGALLGELQPAVMTLDLKMPTLDGFAVLAHLKEHKLNTKVLVISGESKERLASAKNKGAHDSLSKPFENKDLTEKVERLLKDSIKH